MLKYVTAFTINIKTFILLQVVEIKKGKESVADP
jgi:hypothetical protein